MYGNEPHSNASNRILANNRDGTTSELSHRMEQQAGGDYGHVVAEDRHTALLQLIDSWKECPIPAEADSSPCMAASPTTVAKDQQMQTMSKPPRNLPIDMSHRSTPEYLQTMAQSRCPNQLLSATLLAEEFCTKQPRLAMAKHIPVPFSYDVDEYSSQTMSCPELPIRPNPVLLGCVFSL